MKAKSQEKENTDPTILCTQEQQEQLQGIAQSTSAGIWTIKRAKVILGTLEGKSVDRLVLDLRVPPMSIIQCRRKFAEQGMRYFARAKRAPTAREASVERILAFLAGAPHRSAGDWDSLTHRYIGIHFSARQIQIVRDLIASNPRCTRTGLAREVCSRFELYQPNGKMRVATVCDILKRMDMDNLITLPAIPQKNFAAYTHGGDPPAVTSEPMEPERIEIHELRFVPVNTRNDAELWNSIISRHHYIKSYRLYGPRLRYLVYGKEKTALNGWEAATEGAPGGLSMRGLPTQSVEPPVGERLLAVLGFAPSAWRLSSRDAFIGWTDEQRLTNLRYVVGNARFLILPWIKSPNLASRILSGVVRQLPQDWQDRYHYRPVLLETFVQLDRFTGACYKAANWICLGTTKGYSLYGVSQKKQVPNKAVLVYPLSKKFRAILCSTGG